jgi:hypothetical protein
VGRRRHRFHGFNMQRGIYPVVGHDRGLRRGVPHGVEQGRKLQPPFPQKCAVRGPRSLSPQPHHEWRTPAPVPWTTKSYGRFSALSPSQGPAFATSMPVAPCGAPPTPGTFCPTPLLAVDGIWYHGHHLSWTQKKGTGGPAMSRTSLPKDMDHMAHN